MAQSKVLQTKKIAFPLVGLLLCLLLLLGVAVVSLMIGAATVHPTSVIQAIFAYNGSQDHLIVLDSRLPRTLVAIGVGSSLAVAGALMQAITKNPLAAPSIMGVNAGASLLVVITTLFLGISSLAIYSWASLLGATAAGLLVYFVGSAGRRGMTPLKLTVAGATISTLLSSLTQGLLVIRESSMDEVRFWLAGSVSGRTLPLLVQVLPFMLIGLLIAFALSRQITALSMGDDVARGLGVRVGWIKAFAAAAIMLLAGGAVAIAGPVAFVGLVIPHVTRALVGVDYRRVLPFAALLGAVLMVASDILARLVVHPGEVPVGAVTALIGAPVLIWLVRQKGRKG